MEIRNIAIIAHVDHGKTTITDQLMKQTGMVTEDVSMDSNALEQERGITIYAKNTSVFYKDTKINILDTPGHADFGSEVERVLRSIDSVLLIVDAQEGPMPQTKFVLKKSLELGLKPVVVINKIDKPAARPEEVVDEVLELFMDLGANDDQLDFETVYAIGKDGLAFKNIGDESTNMDPLLDTVLEVVDPAKVDTQAPLQMQAFNLFYDNFLGRMAVCRVYAGKAKVKETVFVHNTEKGTYKASMSKMFTFEGTQRKEVDTVEAGDIVMIAGIPDVFIGDTIVADEATAALPSISIDEPTISLGFMVNSSPFAGKEGKFVTNSQIKERLEKELEMNVGLQIDFEGEYYTVYGRGEMHIAILLENMRREGFEVQVSQPQVIFKEEDGVTTEPFEELTIDVPDEMSGMVIEKISKRKGIMTQMVSDNGQTRLMFDIPTRGLLGLRSEFVVDTRGEGIMASRVIGFRPHVGEIDRHITGAMVSMEQGKALGYSLDNLQTRGVLYIHPGTEVYKGMVIGNVAKGVDMTVNPIKGKQLTNMRSAGSDDALKLAPPWELSLERGLEIMREDEYLEVTPESVRLRKKEFRK
jgi:GTP-binding protein